MTVLPVGMASRSIARMAGISFFARAVAAILALTPGLFALLTFQHDIDMQSQLRSLSVPIRLGELAIVLVAMHDGCSLQQAFRRLSLKMRTGAGIWALAVVLSALGAKSDPASALLMATGTLLHGVLALALHDRLRVNDCGPTLLRAAGIGLLGYALVAIFAALLASRWTDFDWHYFGVGVSNVRQIGFYGLPLIAIASGELARGSAANRRWAGLAFMVAGLFLVIWSGGRASLLGAVAAIVTVLVLAGPRARRDVLLVTGLGMLVAAPLAQSLSFSSEYGFSGLVRLITQAQDLNTYGSSRLQIWWWALEAIRDKPLVGHGEGQFAWMILKFTGLWLNHPHNVLLQWAYEWGLAGFAALAFMLGCAIRNAAGRSGPWDGSTLACLSGLAGLSTTAMFDAALYYPAPVVCAILFLTLLCSPNVAARPERTPR